MRTDKQSATEENLQITIPSVTKKSLRMKAAQSGETMRVLVLRALASAGIRVPDEEIQDRRKAK
jgi:NaMN:DMB phosphoribosyltransferase